MSRHARTFEKTWYILTETVFSPPGQWPRNSATALLPVVFLLSAG
jgi:hypothetical protein